MWSSCSFILWISLSRGVKFYSLWDNLFPWKSLAKLMASLVDYCYWHGLNAYSGSRNSTDKSEICFFVLSIKGYAFWLCRSCAVNVLWRFDFWNIVQYLGDRWDFFDFNWFIDKVFCLWLMICVLFLSWRISKLNMTEIESAKVKKAYLFALVANTSLALSHLIVKILS